MTADTFRRIALRLPNAAELAHMGHPDFRVGGRIFATLDYPRPGWAAVFLSPFDQAHFIKAHPRAFVRIKGKWGEMGATNIELRYAKSAEVEAAVRAAYDTRVAKSSKPRKSRAR